MKKQLSQVVRGFHHRLLTKPLPKRLAIYFHELEMHQWADFEICVSHFMNNGYQSVSVTDYVSDKSNNRRVSISFDDNYRSWHQSLKILDKLGVKAMFYVNSAFFRDGGDQAAISDYFDRIRHSGEKHTLTRSELLEIVAAGHEIGCHTHTHPVLSKTPRSLWDAEILDSKNLLEDILQQEVPHFSYPYGMRRHFSDPLLQYCADVGFKTVAAAIPGMQHSHEPYPKMIHRSGWRFSESLEDNLVDLCVDGRWFEKITGRSAVA